MVILGIDPGSRKAGWGVVSIKFGKAELIDFGVIYLDVSRTHAERLGCLASTISEIATKFSPSTVVVENVFVGKSAYAALMLGQARGAVLATLAGAGFLIINKSPTDIKQTITGNGRATKDQINRMVRILLEIQGDIPEDAADALALALAHARSAVVGSVVSLEDKKFRGHKNVRSSFLEIARAQGKI